MYLIDTNVMLAASAVYSVLSNCADEAEPKDPVLRELVYNWLCRFDRDDHIIVMDEEFLIREEYEQNMFFNSNMREQEYGIQVLQSKQDRGLIEYVPVEFLDANGEKVAILSDELTSIVTDRADRKWVAAAQSAQLLLSTSCPIVYGAESDWHLIKQKLAFHEIAFEPLLPEEWYEEKAGRHET